MTTSGLGYLLSETADPDVQKFMHEGISYNSKDAGELQNALKVSPDVDVALAYSSEKLANLEKLLLHVLEGENVIGAFAIENDMITSELLEKACTFDLLFAILNFELRELDSLMSDVQILIVDALHQLSSCEQPTELLHGVVIKLHNSEELVKQSEERILEMKIQLTKLQMTSFSFNQNEWKRDLGIGLNEDHELTRTDWKPQIQTVEQRRVLRMLEKSLAGELDLGKKLAELKQNEEDLKLKIRLVEQVAICMEEAAEDSWGRFLEADNRAEVLMGISKEMLGKLQNFHLNQSGSTKREEETKSKLQDSINLLNAKETLIQKLQSSISELMIDNKEVTSLREKVCLLEEKLTGTESQLKETCASNETSQNQLKEMESEMETLRENIHAAEIRAESAEEKATHLTESNLELTEELDFLKGTNDNNAKKVSILEKELREFDILLQHAKASSGASQEQQNMLYSAIWDMETLIDELRQKVATAESKTESVEERCIMLSETNSDLNKELSFLRSRMDIMEISLNQAALEKKLSAEDISIRTSLIMDTVMKLAMERERIQKQLIHLTKENRLLRENIKDELKPAPKVLQDNTSCNEKEFPSSGLDTADAEPEKASTAEVTELSSESFQVEKSPTDDSVDENQTSSSSTSNQNTNLIVNLEDDGVEETGTSWKMHAFIAVLVVVLSILLAAGLFQKEFTRLKLVEN